MTTMMQSELAVLPAPETPTACLGLGADAPQEQWEAFRREGIGGSDVAALLGLAGKYTSPRHVYEEKHGRPTFVETEAAEIGREIEDFIASMFSKRADLETAVTPGTYVNLDRPWMRANVDRFVLNPDGSGAVIAPLECKNRSEYQIDDWEDGVPDAPAIQCYWYMAVCGWDHGYVAALVGGNKLRWHRLERDEDIIGELVEHCEGWFQRHVVEGAPPPADGLEATEKLLARLWEVTPETIAEISVDEARRLRAEHAKATQAVEDATAYLRRVQNEMRLAAGANEIVKAGGVPVWTNKQNSTFAPKRFRTEQPELAARYTHMVKAIDTDRLKADDEAMFRRYRARQLRVPAKAKGI